MSVVSSRARRGITCLKGFLAALGMTLWPLLAPAATLQPDPELRQALLAAVNASDSFEHRFEAEVWLSDMSDRMNRYVPAAIPVPMPAPATAPIAASFV